MSKSQNVYLLVSLTDSRACSEGTSQETFLPSKPSLLLDLEANALIVSETMLISDSGLDRLCTLALVRLYVEDQQMYIYNRTHTFLRSFGTNVLFIFALLLVLQQFRSNKEHLSTSTTHSTGSSSKKSHLHTEVVFDKVV